MFVIKFDEQVIKRDKKRIPAKDWFRILGKIKSSLSENPLQHSKGLKGNLKGLFRLRVGDYRIVFSIDNQANLVLILKIGHRSEIYREKK